MSWITFLKEDLRNRQSLPDCSTNSITQYLVETKKEEEKPMSKLFYRNEVSTIVKIALANAARDIATRKDEIDTDFFRLTRIASMYELADSIEAELDRYEKEEE